MSIKAGDLVVVDLNPTKGGEKSKTRPCLVLVGEGHPWNIITIVPVTDNKGKKPVKLFVSIPYPNEFTNLSKNSCIDCFQIRCIATSRIKNKLGVVSQDTLDNVLSRIGTILNIGEEHIKLR